MPWRRLTKLVASGALIAAVGTVPAVAPPTAPAFAAVGTANATATNPKPCSLLAPAQVDSALGKTSRPTVKATSGGTSSSPVLVCTYSWPTASLVVRAISAQTESASGGKREAGMGPDGLLIQAATYSWVAFIKNGWSVWLIAKPVVRADGILALGRSAYKRFP